MLISFSNTTNLPVVSGRDIEFPDGPSVEPGNSASIALDGGAGYFAIQYIQETLVKG